MFMLIIGAKKTAVKKEVNGSKYNTAFVERRTLDNQRRRGARITLTYVCLPY